MFLRLCLAGLFAAALGLAQGGNRSGGNRGGGNNMPTMGDFRRSQDKLERIGQMLNLSKDQKKSVKTIFDDAQKEAAPLRDALGKGRAQIAAAVQAGKSQDEVNQAVASYSVIEAQMAALEMQAFSKVFAGLEGNQKSNQQGIQGLFVMMGGMFSGKNWNSE